MTIPTMLRLDVMRMCHDDATSGHEGQDKTLDFLSVLVVLGTAEVHERLVGKVLCAN